MRALSNLIHDASHSNITRNTRLNDFIANLLAGMPLASPVNEYRRSHILHHKNLSHPTLDPDMQTHHRYGYSETYPPHREWYLNILFIVFNFEAWKDSLFGSWHEANRKNKVFICIWWIVGLSILALTSPKQILTFIIFWLLTRSTGYHFVRIIAEFLDHSGLPVGSIRKNCRDLSSSNFVLKYLFHPHNDCFHALHHFEPRIPTHQLKKAHAFAKDHIPIYKEVRKNSGYLLGSAPALSEVGSL
jgi:fatty acid desaturase